MSILLHDQIVLGHRNNKIHIKPFHPDQVGPNSYDVRLGHTLKVYTNEVLDVKIENPVETLKIPKEGLVLEPGTLYLGNTIEAVGSDYYVPMYEGRSSMARLGIQSHISAGFGDIGFKSNWTLEIIVHKKIRIYGGMKIGQIYFHGVDQMHNINNNLYRGKYYDQTEPQQSKSFNDFQINKQKIELGWGC